MFFPAGLRDRDCEDEFVRTGIFETGRRLSVFLIDGFVSAFVRD